MRFSVIIPAAGRSRRFNEASEVPVRSKVEQPVADKPIFLRSIELFLGRESVERIILAVNPDELESFRVRWGDKLGFHGVALVAGGRVERWETVKLALEHVAETTTHVVVHDAARPLTPPGVIDRVFAAAGRYDAVIPALPVAGTLKRVEAEVAGADESGGEADPLDAILGDAGKAVVVARRVVETVSRENVVEVQTPQVFRRELLERAYGGMAGDGVGGEMASITDDAALVEALGEAVHVVEGDPVNFKITRRADLGLAELIAAQQAARTTRSLARKGLFADDDDDL